VKAFVKNAIASLFFSVLFLLVMLAPVRAQVLAHSGDVAGTVGYDHTSFTPANGPTSTHFFGGSGGYNVTPYITGLFEYKYDPLNYSGGSITYHSQLFGGAVRFNLTPSKKIVPYAVVGGGDERFTGSEGGVSVSTNGYYVNFGGGASCYMGRNWGVRPEVRYERQAFTWNDMNATGNVVDVSGSFFYQFGGTGTAKKKK
jgi:hypothetical protein